MDSRLSAALAGTASRGLDRNTEGRVEELAERRRTKRLDWDGVRCARLTSKRRLNLDATITPSPTRTPSVATRSRPSAAQNVVASVVLKRLAKRRLYWHSDPDQDVKHRLI